MGLHTGLAAPHGADYRALAVHQAGRVMSSAHGGQVLLSSATMDRLSALDDTTVIPLGRFAVRDFEDPVRLFQLAGEGLPTGFPAIRAVPADGHNLVPPPTSLHGRNDAMDDLCGRIGAGRLVTLTGPGGVGKTPVAIEVGLRLADDWADGAWMVDLAPIDEPSLIAPAVATALGMPGRGADRWAEVVDHLVERQALVIFDNCERLADECGRLLEDLLACARDVVPWRPPGCRSAPPGGSHAPGDARRRRSRRWLGPCRRPVPRSGRSVRRGLAADATRPAGRSPTSASGSTACRWRSSWRQPGSRCSRRPSSSTA